MPDTHAHCGFCGAAYPAGMDWPRTCPACGHTAYRNPVPVAVLLVPVGDGLLTIRRDIEPRRGELALPGGFINLGESWQAAAARELAEETGLQVDPAAVRLFDALSAPDGTLLVFGTVPPLSTADLPAFLSDGECSERVVIHESNAMAFPLHEQIVRRFFAGA